MITEILYNKKISSIKIGPSIITYWKDSWTKCVPNSVSIQIIPDFSHCNVNGKIKGGKLGIVREKLLNHYSLSEWQTIIHPSETISVINYWQKEMF